MIGTVFSGKFELVAQTADGPIFTAYLGREKPSGRDVSIRLFRNPFDQELDFIDAVGRAVRRAATVSHPGVERIDGLEYDAGRPYLLGQASPGITLAERIRKLAPFSVPVAVGTTLSILEALEAIHQAQLVHGDISAENIIIGPDGSARLQMAAIWEAYSKSTTAGAVVLPSLAPFLAPEVSAGGIPTPTSDVYSVGILLFELVCGRPPYAAETPVAMAMKHATSATPSVKAYIASAPMVLDEIVKKAMSKDPAYRYRTAGAMYADLKALQDALRFGRTLSWPIRPTDVVAPSEPLPVAPRMSAARPAKENVSRRSNSSDRFEDGIPPFLRYIAVGLACVLAGAFLMYIFANARQPRLVTVPKLLGKDVAEARSILQSMKLELREGPHEQSSTAAADTVLASRPDAGEKVREGSSVTVTLSEGSELVAVPDLHGMTLDTAIAALRKLNLSVEQPVDRIDSKTDRDTVVDQIPNVGDKVDRGSSIRLKVSNGIAPVDGADATKPDDASKTGNPTKPDDQTTPTDTTKPANDGSDAENKYTLKIKLRDTDVPVQVRVEIEDSHGSRTVFEESEDPNDSFTVEATGYGPTATFRIYYDGELKKTLHERPHRATRRRRRTAPENTDSTPTNPTPPTGDTQP